MPVLLQHPGEFFEIVNEASMFQPASFIIGRAQDRGRMNGSHDVRRESGLNEFPALFGDAKFCTEQRLSSSGAKRNYHFRFDDGYLGFEPGTTGGNFLTVWFFMNAPFATRFPLEVFDNIRDVGLRTIDAGLGKRVVKKSARWTNERFAGEIFFVTRLLTDKQDGGASPTFAEHCLGAAFPKVTRFAIGGGVAQQGQT